MRQGRHTTWLGTLAALEAVLALVTACTPPPEPPDTNLHHVTIWQGDVAHPDSDPDIVDWVGYGSFAYNIGLGGCSILEGGAGWTESFVRIDPATVRVTITLDWIEGDNGIDPYGCGVVDELNAGLLDATGSEVAFGLIPLVSHS